MTDALTFPEIYRLTRQIVESPPVMATYAATQWDELSQDGHVWLCAIVSELLYLAPEILSRKRFPDPRVAIMQEWLKSRGITGAPDVLKDDWGRLEAVVRDHGGKITFEGEG